VRCGVVRGRRRKVRVRRVRVGRRVGRRGVGIWG